MKKLKLKLEGIKQMLTKEQMKEINGGYSSCYLNCFGAVYYIDPNIGCDENYIRSICDTAYTCNCVD